MANKWLFKTNSVVSFLDYNPPNPDGALKSGDRLMVIEQKKAAKGQDPNAYLVSPIDADGNVIEDDNGPIIDNLFEDEMEPAKKAEPKAEKKTPNAANKAAGEKAKADQSKVEAAAKKATEKVDTKEKPKTKPATKKAQPKAEKKTPAKKVEKDQSLIDDTDGGKEDTKEVSKEVKQPELVDKGMFTPDSNIVAHSQKVIASNGDIAAAKKFARQGRISYVLIGLALCQIKQDNSHASLGYKIDGNNFDKSKEFYKFAEEHLGLKQKSASNYMSIIETFKSLGDDKFIDKLADVDMSKALKIVAASKLENVSADDVMGMLEFATDNSREELVNKISVEHKAGKEAEAEVKYTKVNLSFHNDEGNNVLAAIDSVNEKDGTDTPEKAILSIIAEWDANINNNPDYTQEVAISMLESRFNISLQVVDGSDDGKEE